MIKQKELTELKKGETARMFLLLQKMEMRKTKHGSNYLDLVLRDRKSEITGKFWRGFELFFSNVKVGDIVKIEAKVDDYNGMKQLNIERAQAASKSDGVSVDDFLPKSERDLSVMIDELNDFIASIKNTFIKKLIEKMLSGGAYEKYIRVPAGKSWHHAYISGLIEHTLEIIKICDLMSSFHKEINRDLLIAGAILHDYGKVEELTFENGFDYTNKGKLLGHIVICSNKINETASEIPNFPKDLLDLIQHLVLSHQGKLEQASPVIPKTVEAIALYHADELSAKTNAYINAVRQSQNENPDSEWTKFLPLAGSSIFVNANSPDEEIKETLF